MQSERGLRHILALDGLRGLAVIGVIIFHAGRLEGGYLGVDLFFVLSGYLITTLLVDEHHRRDRIDLGRFWARRARRLLPALLLVLFAAAIGTIVMGELARAALRPDAFAALFYVANWNAIVADHGYWVQFTEPSPLSHMWSLAIEEQFYLVWPLVAVFVLGRARRRSCLLYTSPSPRDQRGSRMPSSA